MPRALQPAAVNRQQIVAVVLTVLMLGSSIAYAGTLLF